MALGCHGSCITNYPGGRAPPLCPHFFHDVCRVRGIIFPIANFSLRQWTAAEITGTLLTPERQGKYKLRKADSRALICWLSLFAMNLLYAIFCRKKPPAWILFPSAWGLTCCVFIIMIQTIFTTQCFYICLLPHSQLICIPNLYKGHFTGNMLLIFKVAKFAKVCVGLSHITHLYNNTSVEEHVVENAFE